MKDPRLIGRRWKWNDTTDINGHGGAAPMIRCYPKAQALYS